MSGPYRAYWNERALAFASAGSGLGAVASYGMPSFYNRGIDLVQWLAMSPWLRLEEDTPVLDVGCGIGRWSRRLARRGARVIGVDPSVAMIREATRRTAASGLSDRCRFVVGDLTELRLAARFDRIVAVTVLQHIPGDAALTRALENLKALLAPGGRVVLLEVAPGRPTDRCDSRWFEARSFGWYRDLFHTTGLKLVDVKGVDPSPLKIWLLPYYRTMPRALGGALLFLATALAVPVEVVLGRALAGRSWHKLMVLAHDD